MDEKTEGDVTKAVDQAAQGAPSVRTEECGGERGCRLMNAGISVQIKKRGSTIHYTVVTAAPLPPSKTSGSIACPRSPCRPTSGGIFGFVGMSYAPTLGSAAPQLRRRHWRPGVWKPKATSATDHLSSPA